MCYPLVVVLVYRHFSTCTLIERLTETLWPYFLNVYVFLSTDKIYRLVVFLLSIYVNNFEKKSYFNELLFHPNRFFIDSFLKGN